MDPSSFNESLRELLCLPGNGSINGTGTGSTGNGSACDLLRRGFRGPPAPTGVSVSVSTFSLVAIAIERHSAICHPLQARAWQTRSHACRVIAATWLLSLLLMVPYAVYSTTRAAPAGATRCLHAWPSQEVRQGWYLLLLLLLFFVPGLVLAVSYSLISRELCRGLRFQLHLKGQMPAPAPPGDDGDGCYVQLAGAGSTLELRALAGAGPGRARANSSDAKLAAKRRVIRMLAVIVALFFLCWLPVFAANTWRAFSPRAAQRALAGTPISFIHLLSYTSACANPLIYCFMNRRFRQALLATACASPCQPRARPRPALPPAAELPTASASLSRGSCATVSSLAAP
ncbi:gastrin/cholecystokinin type B receptor isoform X2 [Pogoniulus pusillus]|uniref:gastrin/cholecystokinin type B receptor isoform X2 n=1 Tax=Pogoniulus pusillus TaxID=488313 RepID=UPI0030B9766F